MRHCDFISSQGHAAARSTSAAGAHVPNSLNSRLVCPLDVGGTEFAGVGHNR